MPSVTRPILTCFPDPVVPRVVIFVIILTFIVILARLGYSPELALGVVMAAAAAIDPRPALDPGARSPSGIGRLPSMPRPEKKITGDGPVADLAHELRELRIRAGRPTYRKMAQNARYSASVLAAAAAGNHCPTWQVVEAFIQACGEQYDAAWRSMWVQAQKAAARRTPVQRRTAPGAPEAGTSPHRHPAARRVTLPPDPWQARTPEEYVRQLRALRAWAGKPGVKEIGRAGVELGLVYDPGTAHWRGDLVPSSTVYDTLNPRRAALPKPQIVQMIVRACHADVEVWTAAWQALAMRAFEAENPPLPAAEQDDPRATRGDPPRTMRLVG
jgi:Helix-turn-helix domain